MRQPTDSDLVSRTSSSIAVHSQPAVRDVSGPVVETVSCPLCGMATVLHAAVDRVEGRCPECTVVVRVVDGVVRACGWMGGGDFDLAGAAVRPLRSALERNEAAESGDACGEASGTTAGYWRHRKAEEKACELCLEASRTYNRERKKKRAAA